MPFADPQTRAPCLDLFRRHQARMIVLVALKRQADAFDRIGDETDRPVMVDAFKGFEQAIKIMPAEIGHQGQQFFIRAAFNQSRDRPLIADLVEQPFAKRRPALKAQSGIKRVRTFIDPFLQNAAALFRKGLLHQAAIFDDHDIPAEIAENGLELFPQAFADHRIKALAVVIDNPPAIAQILFPAVKQRLVNIALVHFRIAHQRDHAAFGTLLHPAMFFHIVLDDGGEQRLRHAKPHRPR